MRNTVRMISVLTVVGLVSGLALVSVYNYASPLITNNQKNEIEQAVFKIFPEGKNYEEKIIENETIFTVEDRNGKFLGYVFLTEGNGYQGPIKMMVGIEPDLETLKGIEILESQETPGLGQEITQDKFKSQFIGLKTPIKPDGIQAITGATVSSKAVVSILNEKIKIINEQSKLHKLR